MRRFAFLAIAAMCLVGTASAQCPNTVISTYGAGCAPQFDVPKLGATFDPSTCSVTMELTGFPGCCNTFLVAKLLVIGLQQAAIPAPGIGPGCTLLVNPTIIASLPSSTTQLNVPLTPSLIGLDVHSQVINQYFTTIGLTTDFTASNGLTMKFL